MTRLLEIRDLFLTALNSIGPVQIEPGGPSIPIPVLEVLPGPISVPSYQLRMISDDEDVNSLRSESLRVARCEVAVRVASSESGSPQTSVLLASLAVDGAITLDLGQPGDFEVRQESTRIEFDNETDARIASAFITYSILYV